MASTMSICRNICKLVTIGAQCRCITPVFAANLNLLHLSASRELQISPCVRSSNASEEGNSEANDELEPERLYSKIRIKVKGADFRVLESYCRYVITAAKALDINISGRVALPTHFQKFTVLKSAHIYKKHRVQYEIRTHIRLVQIKEITGTTADVFLEYIQRNLPEGVSMGVYQERLDTLPLLLLGTPKTEEPTTSTKKISSKKGKNS